jgi:pimeloyl-ACP methyl ester carboxylesterase
MMKKRYLLCVLLLVFSSLSLLHAEDSFFDSNGVKIHYIVEGKGEPVVLIHGWANSIQEWVPSGVVKALSGNYKVIALDTRGHGQSDKPHGVADYGLKMNDDVIRLMDHLKIKKAHIVGYSMGGLMTDRLLMDHPERFVTATLGGAGWLKRGEGAPGLDPAAVEVMAKALEEGKGLGPVLVFLSPKGQPPTEEAIGAANKTVMASNDALALAAAIRGMAGFWVPEDKLRKNKIPVLSLIGELDPMKDGVDRLQSVLANLKVVVIPSAKHSTAPRDPMFIKSLEEFLAAHPASQHDCGKGPAGVQAPCKSY